MLWLLMQIMRQRRCERGALTLASAEVKFEIDSETHDPLDIGMRSCNAYRCYISEFAIKYLHSYIKFNRNLSNPRGKSNDWRVYVGCECFCCWEDFETLPLMFIAKVHIVQFFILSHSRSGWSCAHPKILEKPMEPQCPLKWIESVRICHLPTSYLWPFFLTL